MAKPGDVESGKARSKRQVWIQYVLAGAGAAWGIGWLGKTYWSISSSLSVLGKGIWLAILLCTLLYMVNIFLPVRGEVTEVEDMWSFIRGPKPQDPILRSTWWRWRRHLALIGVWLALWMCYGVAITVGLAKA